MTVSPFINLCEFSRSSSVAISADPDSILPNFKPIQVFIAVIVACKSKNTFDRQNMNFCDPIVSTEGQISTVMCTLRCERSISISIRCQKECAESKLDGQTDSPSDYSAQLGVVQNFDTKTLEYSGLLLIISICIFLNLT